MARGKLDARKREAQPEFDAWLAGIKPEDLKNYVPQEGLALRAPLNEGEGKSRQWSSTANRVKSRTKRTSYGPKVATPRKRPSPSAPPALELADVGDFDSDQAFSTSIWVRLGRRNQTGAILARMDSDSKYRGWDLWLEGDKVGMHIVDNWPDDALKVVAQTPLTVNTWTHVCVTYDGSKKASGVKSISTASRSPRMWPPTSSRARSGQACRSRSASAAPTRSCSK